MFQKKRKKDRKSWGKKSANFWICTLCLRLQLLKALHSVSNLRHASRGNVNKEYIYCLLCYTNWTLREFGWTVWASGVWNVYFVTLCIVLCYPRLYSIATPKRGTHVDSEKVLQGSLRKKIRGRHMKPRHIGLPLQNHSWNLMGHFDGK